MIVADTDQGDLQYHTRLELAFYEQVYRCNEIDCSKIAASNRQRVVC